jgi:hypothetical protein
VEVPDSASLRPAQLTVEAWLNPDAVMPNLSTVLTKTSTTSWADGYGFYAPTPGTIAFFVNHWSSHRVTAALPANTWSHVAGTYDGTAIRLYVNGALAASLPYTTPVNHATRPLRIGLGEGGNYPWRGQIDEVRILSTARTEAEIRADMGRRLTAAEPGLAAYWDFDEADGTAVLDQSSFGNHGALTGTPAPTREPGLTFLPPWVVYLDQNRNGIREPAEAFATPDVDGRYQIGVLVLGTYDVALEGQPGWTATTPPQGRTTVVAAAGQTATADFGVTPADPDPGPRAPAITSTAPAVAEAGQLYRYQALVANPDGRPLTFDLPVKPEGMAVDPATGVVVWVPRALQLGSHRVLLRVKDDRGLVDIQDITLVVARGNTAPVLTSTPPEQAVLARPYRYQVLAQDAEETALQFALEQAPAGMTIDANTGRIDWTPAVDQVRGHDVTVMVRDGRGGKARQSFSLTVAADAANRSPVVTSSWRDFLKPQVVARAVVAPVRRAECCAVVAARRAASSATATNRSSVAIGPDGHTASASSASPYGTPGSSRTEASGPTAPASGDIAAGLVS